jgi:hypothetical protein
VGNQQKVVLSTTYLFLSTVLTTSLFNKICHLAATGPYLNIYQHFQQTDTRAKKRIQ